MDKYKEYMNEFECEIDTHVHHIIEWMQDEFKKTHADGVILGMSGGLDCSVVAVLCKMANIPIQLVSMPRGDSMNYGQMKDAEELCNKFKLKLVKASIGSICERVQEKTEKVYARIENKSLGNKEMANANIAPIMRMTILSTLGQSMNFVMIGTGNLTERYIGNFTKRGDGLSDFNPLGELTKTEIRIIAKHIGVPDSIIMKAPSADLWEGQTDESEMGLLIEDIDRFLLTGECEREILEKIKERHEINLHKLVSIPIMPRNML